VARGAGAWSRHARCGGMRMEEVVSHCRDPLQRGHSRRSRPLATPEAPDWHVAATVRHPISDYRRVLRERPSLLGSVARLPGSDGARVHASSRDRLAAEPHPMRNAVRLPRRSGAR
jgi:hypothetical protein